MYNYHTVLSYSVSIHTLNASLMSQNSLYRKHPNPQYWFLHIYGAKFFSK